MICYCHFTCQWTAHFHHICQFLLCIRFYIPHYLLAQPLYLCLLQIHWFPLEHCCHFFLLGSHQMLFFTCKSRCHYQLYGYNCTKWSVTSHYSYPLPTVDIGFHALLTILLPSCLITTFPSTHFHPNTSLLYIIFQYNCSLCNFLVRSNLDFFSAFATVPIYLFR